jgi:hypothetical protein
LRLQLQSWVARDDPDDFQVVFHANTKERVDALLPSPFRDSPAAKPK